LEYFTVILGDRKQFIVLYFASFQWYFNLFYSNVGDRGSRKRFICFVAFNRVKFRIKKKLKVAPAINGGKNNEA
jgi:hypothetical protein